MPTLKESALNYLSQGFSVIPFYPKKNGGCCLSAYTQFRDRLPTEAFVRAWWNRWPDAMIAIVGGKLSDICMVDCDSQESLDIVNALLPDNYECPIDITPRDGTGQHFYFRNETTLKSKDAIIPKLDFKGEGGVLFVSPSIRNDGQYKPLNGCALSRENLQPIPAGLLEFLKQHIIKKKNTDTNENNEELKKLWNGTSEGGRNQSLTRLVGSWVKLELSKEECLFNANLWNTKNKPPLPENEIVSIINSVFNTDSRNNGNLSEEVREWVEGTHGDFDYKSCDFDLDLKSKAEKTNRRKIFNRMKKDNKIVGIQGKNGWFRRVESEIIWTDYVNVTPSSIKLEMPLGISNIVKFSPKSIIIITGDTNAGKTSFFLNIVKTNNYKFFYFNLEMSAETFRGRLDDYGLPIEFWTDKMKMSERGNNIADAIQPNDINIIDYLKCNWDTPWTTSIKIDEIFDKLDQGIAIIGLQKKSGQSIPRGGEGTLERAQLAIGLHRKTESQFQTAEILKAKKPATKFDPNFCKCDFRYGDNYTDIIKINDWRRD